MMKVSLQLAIFALVCVAGASAAGNLTCYYGMAIASFPSLVPTQKAQPADFCTTMLITNASTAAFTGSGSVYNGVTMDPVTAANCSQACPNLMGVCTTSYGAGAECNCTCCTTNACNTVVSSSGSSSAGSSSSGGSGGSNTKSGNNSAAKFSGMSASTILILAAIQMSLKNC